jgi:hypothetical protein
MAFVRADDGKYLMVYTNDFTELDEGLFHQDLANDEIKFRMTYIKMKAVEMLPDSDAFLVMPARPKALKGVVEVRRQVLILVDYLQQLQMLPDVAANGLPLDTRLAADEDVVYGEEGVQAVTRDCFELCNTALRKLVVNLRYVNI